MIRHSLWVAARTPIAFRAYTEHVHDWWPADHVPQGSAMLHVRFEPDVGGRLLMDTPEGTVALGCITAWSPPHELAYDFYPGSTEAEPSTVRIRFTPEQGGTRVDIEHDRGRIPAERWAGPAQGFRRAWRDLVDHFQRFVNGGPP